MKILDGKDLSEYIKARHAKQVRTLRGQKISPKLVIIQVKDDPVINTYVKLKKNYGKDIGVEVEVIEPKQADIETIIKAANKDEAVHGIIVQLPLEDISETEEIVNMVDPDKDVDALGEKAVFEPATPNAILWLLGGYGIDLSSKKILLIGRGKLVGAPLEKILKNSGCDVTVIDRKIKDLKEHTITADIIITATGSPAVIYAEMIKKGAVVVDAGVASESGKTVGDLADDVYQRDDLIITPRKGGVGPLTVCALFENVIRSASAAK